MPNAIQLASSLVMASRAICYELTARGRRGGCGDWFSTLDRVLGDRKNGEPSQNQKRAAE
jgi:hypothetical protein